MRFYFFIFILLLPNFAFAHGAATTTGGSVSVLQDFLSGLLHPILGLDHLLAMVSVGIVSALIGARAIWLVPATFVGVMVVGCLIGIAGLVVPFVEQGIALSVLVLGAMIAIKRALLPQKVLVIITYLFVAIFATFHGYAHGLEMPLLANPWFYILGFMFATCILHLVGVVIGQIAGIGKRSRLLVKSTGGIIAVIGLYLLA